MHLFNLHHVFVRNLCVSTGFLKEFLFRNFHCFHFSPRLDWNFGLGVDADDWWNLQTTTGGAVGAGWWVVEASDVGWWCWVVVWVDQMLMQFLTFENQGVLVKEMLRFFNGFDDADWLALPEATRDPRSFQDSNKDNWSWNSAMENPSYLKTDLTHVYFSR